MNRRLLPLLLLLLLPFVVIVGYVQPSLDDLSIPLQLRAGETTRPEIFWRLMHSWNGRYTSNLLAVLSPTTWGSLFGYRLLLALQFPALYFALYYLLSRLLSPVNTQPDINPSPAPNAPPESPLAPHNAPSSSRPPDLSSSRPPFFSSLTSHFSSLTSRPLVFSSSHPQFSFSRPRILASSHLRFHLLSAAILLLYLHGLPSLVESIYWLSGAITYTWALIAQLLILGLMADTLEKPSTPKTILLAVLLFIASGFNEIALAINGLLAVGFWLLGRNANFMRMKANSRETTPIHQSTNPPIHSPLTSHLSSLTSHLSLLAVLLAALIVLFSPGNAGRMWHFPHGGHLVPSLGIAAVSTAKLLGVMAQNIPLLLTGFLLFPWMSAESLRPALRPLARLHPLRVAALALLFLLACMLVPAWAMGINPPLRIYNYLLFFALGFFFWFLFSLHAWVYGKARKQESEKAIKPDFSHPRILASSLLLLIFLAMAGDFHKRPTPFGWQGSSTELYTFRGNLPRAAFDLLLRAKPYSQALQQRENYVQQQKALGQTHIVLEPLKNPPTSIFFLDVTSDPNHWINQLQAEWYGVEKVEVRDEK